MRYIFPLLIGSALAADVPSFSPVESLESSVLETLEKDCIRELACQDVASFH